jgi:lipopolysaccharide heptosyltransferase II
MSSVGWSQARNILCIRLDYLGDVLMITPAMRAIRESLPGCSLTLLTSKSGAAIAPYIPEIDDTIVYAAPWLKSSPVQGPDYQLEMVETLRQRNFDAALIFTSFSQNPLPTALLCHLAQIPLSLAHCHENPYQLLTDWVLDLEPTQGIRHEVRRQLDLVATLGFRSSNEKMSFGVRDEDMASVRQRLHGGAKRATNPLILVHPGATAASRRYAPDKWAQVINRLCTDLGADVLVTGDASEIDLVDTIVNDSGIKPPAVQSLAGQLNIGQLGAAIALSSVVVSNNTGPAHMAAAIGTPLVELYALTNPQHTPWQVKSRVLFHDVPCRFCFKSICPQGHGDCLAKVEPAEVVTAVEDLINDKPDIKPPFAGVDILPSIKYRQENTGSGAAVWNPG